MTPPPDPEQKRIRQLRTVTVLGVLLMVAGLVILTVLRRMPLPMRLMAGLSDFFLGLVLIVLARQRRQRP